MDVGRHRRAEVGPLHSRIARRRRQLHRHGASLWARSFRAYCWRRSSRAPGQSDSGHQMRLSLAHHERHLLCRSGWLAHSSLPGRGIHTVRSRTELAAARDRLYRPLPDTLARPHDTDRRDDGRASRPEKAGQDPCDRSLQLHARPVAAIPVDRAGGCCAGAIQHAPSRIGTRVSALLRAEPHCGAGVLAPGQWAADR